MEEAPKIFMADKEPLPIGTYDDLTKKDVYTDNGVSIDETRYIDERYELLRQDKVNNKMIQAACRARPYTKPDSIIFVWATVDLGDLTSQATLIDRNILYNSEDYTQMEAKIKEREDQIALDHEIRDGRKVLKNYMLEQYRNGDHHLANLVKSVNTKMVELDLPGKKLTHHDINTWLHSSGYDRLQTNVDLIYNLLKNQGPKRSRQLRLIFAKTVPTFTAVQRADALENLKKDGKVRQDRKKFLHIVK